jgi:type IV secretory pathway VirD2 relaxase
MFDATSEATDEKDFAERCADDRHHFPFIVSPEDAKDMSDLRAFTHELMKDAERDLGTKLDWIAAYHWNTDHPQIHVLIVSRTDDEQDLVISGDYISLGFRARASERVTLEFRGNIIKTTHRAMNGRRGEPDVSSLALHAGSPADPILGRLAERGLNDELKGSAYAVIEGLDGRTHHIRFANLELTGDGSVAKRGHDARASRTPGSYFKGRIPAPPDRP